MYLIGGVGVFTLQEWARRLSRFIALLSVVLAIVSLGIAIYLGAASTDELNISFGWAFGLLGIGSLAWNAWLIYFFNQPTVKAQFQNRKSPPSLDRSQK